MQRIHIFSCVCVEHSQTYNTNVDHSIAYHANFLMHSYVMVAGTQYVLSHGPYQDLGVVCSIGWSLLKPQNLIRASEAAAEQLNTHHTRVQ